MRTTSLALTLAVTLALPSAIAVAAPTEPAEPADIARAVERAFDDPEIQREWPDDMALSRGTTTPAATSELTPSDLNTAAASHVANFVLWAIAIAVILLILVWLGLAFARHRGEGRGAVHVGAAPPPPRSPHAAEPDDPATLAAQGRYAEALHAMLLRALWTLPQARTQTRAGTTSRELVTALAARTGPARPSSPPTATSAPAPTPTHIDALRELLEAVELTHFGGRPVSAADYERYVPAYRRALDASAPT